LTVMLGDHIYVMEIKVVDGDRVDGNPALEQIVKRNYAQKYRGIAGKEVHEVGLVFGRGVRNLVGE